MTEIAEGKERRDQARYRMPEQPISDPASLLHDIISELEAEPVSLLRDIISELEAELKQPTEVSLHAFRAFRNR